MWRILILIFSRPLPSPRDIFFNWTRGGNLCGVSFHGTFFSAGTKFCRSRAFCKIRQNLDKNCRALGQESVQGQTDEIYRR